MIVFWNAICLTYSMAARGDRWLSHQVISPGTSWQCNFNISTVRGDPQSGFLRRPYNHIWWIIFLVDTISFGLAKNSNLQYNVVWHFIFINFVEYRQKTHYLLYPRFFHVGVVQIDGWREQLTIQQTHSPWWCRLLLHRHGDGESAHPTPGSLYGMGLAESGVRGFFGRQVKKKINHQTQWIYFSILHYSIWWHSKNDAYHPSRWPPLFPIRISSTIYWFRLFLVGCCVCSCRLVFF